MRACRQVPGAEPAPTPNRTVWPAQSGVCMQSRGRGAEALLCPAIYMPSFLHAEYTTRPAFNVPSIHHAKYPICR